MAKKNCTTVADDLMFFSEIDFPDDLDSDFTNDMIGGSASDESLSNYLTGVAYNETDTNLCDTTLGRRHRQSTKATQVVMISQPPKRSSKTSVTPAAIAARENREKNKVYLAELRDSVKQLTEINEDLTKENKKQAKENQMLLREVLYLRNLLANQTDNSQKVGSESETRISPHRKRITFEDLKESRSPEKRQIISVGVPAETQTNESVALQKLFANTRFSGSVQKFVNRTKHLDTPVAVEKPSFVGRHGQEKTTSRSTGGIYLHVSETEDIGMASGSGKTPDLPRGLIDGRSTPAGKAARIFVPTIPVRGEKGKEEIVKDVPDGLHKSAENGPHPRRGWDGEVGLGRGQENLIQLHSLFEQGPTANPSQSRGGDNQVGLRSGRSESSSSSLKVKQEIPKIKEESSWSLDYLMRDNFVADGPQNDKGLSPAMLPMSAAALEIKTEKLETTEISIKEEPMEVGENSNESPVPKNQDSGPSIAVQPSSGKENISCKNLFDRIAKSEKEELIFFQLPEALPGISVPESQLPNSSRDSKKESKDDTEKQVLWSLADFSEGIIGKLRIRKSGKTELMLGSITLDVTMGTPCGFLQDVASIRTNEGDKNMTVLGHVKHRLICTPNFESLLNATMNT